MTPEQINIAIAEACGKIVCGCCGNEIDPGVCHCGDYFSRHDAGSGHSPVPLGCVCGYDDQTKVARNTIPDYCHDLNAMHEAEKSLQDWVAYRINLSKIVGIGYAPDLDICDDIKSFVSATASQRAEAFLRTIGKWVE